MNTQQAKNIKIHEYLAGLGIKPLKQRADNLWYCAPYRKDSNPSFSVNLLENLWYDLGLGQGGSLIDLVQLMHGCSVREALFHISHSSPVPVTTSYDLKTNSIEIRKQLHGIRNPALVEYLRHRAIDHCLASLYLCEIFYQISGKNYFGIGFQNDSKGYELRNKYFKGSIAPKDITTLCNNSNDCCVFEGWPDFLTYLQHFKVREIDYLVLNSVAMVNRSIEKLQKYSQIYYWGQNDKPGEDVLVKLLAVGLPVIDCRFEYSDFKDLNDKYTKK